MEATTAVAAINRAAMAKRSILDSLNFIDPIAAAGARVIAAGDAYPEDPKSDAEKALRARYSKCTGSAVNPVLPYRHVLESFQVRFQPLE